MRGTHTRTRTHIHARTHARKHARTHARTWTDFGLSILNFFKAVSDFESKPKNTRLGLVYVNHFKVFMTLKTKKAQTYISCNEQLTFTGRSRAFYAIPHLVLICWVQFALKHTHLKYPEIYSRPLYKSVNVSESYSESKFESK